MDSVTKLVGRLRKLGISTSYLNLIENNHRPLPARQHTLQRLHHLGLAGGALQLVGVGGGGRGVHGGPGAFRWQRL